MTARLIMNSSAQGGLVGKLRFPTVGILLIFAVFRSTSRPKISSSPGRNQSESPIASRSWQTSPLQSSDMRTSSMSSLFPENHDPISPVYPAVPRQALDRSREDRHIMGKSLSNNFSEQDQSRHLWGPATNSLFGSAKTTFEAADNTTSSLWFNGNMPPRGSANYTAMDPTRIAGPSTDVFSFSTVGPSDQYASVPTPTAPSSQGTSFKGILNPIDNTSSSNPDTTARMTTEAQMVPSEYATILFRYR